MPHIIVKLYPGRSEEAKQALAGKITRAVVEETGCKERSVSVSMEEIPSENWAETVYQKDILNGPGMLYKEPGYDPFKSMESHGTEDKGLMAFVREAVETAAKEDTSGMFNPMSWLDLELEDNPNTFDPFFDVPWPELADSEKQDRMRAVRAAL